MRSAALALEASLSVAKYRVAWPTAGALLAAAMLLFLRSAAFGDEATGQGGTPTTPAVTNSNADGIRSWVSAYGGSANYSTGGVPGYQGLSSSRYAVTLGADKQLSSDFLGGATFSLGRQAFTTGEVAGSSRDYQIGLYGRTAILDRGYIAGSGLFGWHALTTGRLTVGVEFEQGKVTSQEWSGRLEAGYRWRLDDRYSMAPFLGIGAGTFHTPGYSERALSGGNGRFARTYAASDSDVEHTELGARLGRALPFEGLRVWIEATAAWARELDNTPFGSATFSLDPAFALSPVIPSKDTALLGLSAQAETARGLSFGLRLDSQVGGNTTVLFGTGNLAWRW